jgi:hypothetical protein
MITILLQAKNPWQSAHEHFQRGGTLGGLLAAFMTIGGLIGLLYIVHRLQQRKHSTGPVVNPQKLFRTIVRKIGLNVLQRDLLLRVARDLRLQHPVTLLLAPEVFQYHIRKWREKMYQVDRDAIAKTDDAVESLSQVIFGT